MSTEVFPVVAVDRRLGEFASHVGLDYDLLNNYLRNRGLNDEQIMETFITISARTNVTGSDYNAETGRVTVYPTRNMQNGGQKQSVDHSGALVAALELHAIDVLREQPTTGELAAKAAKTSLGAAAIVAACAATGSLLRSITGVDASPSSIKHHLIRHAAVKMAGRALGSNVFKEAIAAIHPNEVQSKKAGKNMSSGLLTITPKK